MSNSLLQQRSSFSFIAFIFLIGLVSALSFSVSPPSSEIDGEVGKKACIEYSLYSSEESKISISDRWSKTGSHAIQDYVLQSDDIGVLVEYSNSINLDGNGKLKVCLMAEENGKYNGVMIFSVENTSISFGTWIGLQVGEYKMENEANSEGNFTSGSMITGRAIAESVVANAFLIELVIFGNLLFILIILLVIFRRQKRFIY